MLVQNIFLWTTYDILIYNVLETAI